MVPFQSPSLPTNSHLPVTVTSAGTGVLDVAAELVRPGLAAGEGEAGAVVLLPQELTAINKPTIILNRETFLIIRFILLEVIAVYRGLNFLSVQCMG
jgi:hypothetical protein